MFGYIYMYINLFFLSLYELNKNKFIKILMYYILINLIIFMGFRGYVYSDWYSYKIIYEKIGTISEILKNKNDYFYSLNYEIFFKVFMSFLKSINKNYTFFVFINSLIEIILLKRIFNNFFNKKIIFPLFCFYGFNGLFYSFDLTRNFKAILIIMFGLKYITKNKKIKYFISVFLASLVHKSSYIYFLIYPILKIKYKRKTLFLLLILFDFLYITHLVSVKKIIFVLSTFMVKNEIANFLFSPIIEYINNIYYGQSSFFSIGFFEKNIFCLLLIIYYDKLLKKKGSYIYINLYFIYTIIYLLSYDFYLLRDRISNLFIFSYWYIIPLLTYNLPKKYRLTFFYLISIYIGYRSIYLNYNVPTKEEKIQRRYENILFDNVDLKFKINNIEKISKFRK